MVRNATGDGVQVMYKDDSSLPGWLPRPAFPEVRTAAWRKHFTGRTKYLPHQVLDSYPVKILKTIDGITQRILEWVYTVKHTNNDVHT